MEVPGGNDPPWSYNLKQPEPTEEEWRVGSAE